MAELNWEWLKSFLAVIHNKSLSGAARELGATQPTIGRHIQFLEEALNLPLFVRSREGLAPTAEALDMAAHVQTMAGASAALQRGASGEAVEESGTVRLAASEVMGVEVLPEMLKKFHRSHPGISIELVVSNRIENLLKREADMAVRMVRPVQGALITRMVGLSPVGLYAHKEYIAQFGLPGSPQEFPGHVGVGPDADVDIIRHLEENGVPFSRGLFAFRTDNQLAQLALVRKGAGIGGVQHALAKQDPALVPVLADQVQIPMEIWVVMHEDLKTSRRIRFLFDFLVKELTGFLGVKPT